MGTANTNSGLSLQRRKTIFWCWLFMLPAISLFLIFQVYPLFANGYYSLFDWNGIGASFRYIGLRNYSRVFLERIGQQLSFYALGRSSATRFRPRPRTGP